MKNRQALAYAIVLTMALISTKCIAVSWQDRASTSSETSDNPGIEAGTQSGGLSLSSLSAMLDGGNATLSANTLANAAGLLEYCATHKLVTENKIENITRALLNTAAPRWDRLAMKDYAQGLSGLLNTRSGQQLDMRDLNHSALAIKVKTRACSLVLRQSMAWLSQ